MTQTVDIGQMIQDELNRQKRNPAWLADLLSTSRSNGYKIVNEKKFNDVLFLMSVSVAMKHNFLKDLAAMIEDEMSTKSEQNV
jgi:hypothetical protein